MSECLVRIADRSWLRDRHAFGTLRGMRPRSRSVGHRVGDPLAASEVTAEGAVPFTSSCSYAGEPEDAALSREYQAARLPNWDDYGETSLGTAEHARSPLSFDD